MGPATDADPDFFDVEPLAPGVWGAISRVGSWALSNSGIVDLGDRTVVFDATLTIASGAALARTVERLTGRRADLVVYSHWHGDHWRGAGALAPIAVAASRRTRQILAERGRASFLEEKSSAPHELAEIDAGRAGRTDDDRATLRGWLGGVAATPDDFPLLLPTLTFDEGLTIHGSRRDLELRAYPGGHSPSDVVGYLPDERLVFLADLGSVGYQPWTTDGSVERFRAALSSVEALRPERFLPGHGAPGGVPEIREVHRYLDAVEAAARGPPPSEGDDSLAAPAPFDRWIFSDQFGRNVAQERALRATGPA